VPAIACPFCGLVCDDLLLEAGRVDSRGCAKGAAGFARPEGIREHRIAGGPVPFAFRAGQFLNLSIQIGRSVLRLNELVVTVNEHTRKLDQLADVVNRHDRKLDDLSASLADLRETLTHYHSSVLGHGILISELDERVRRIELHLNLPSVT